MSILMCFFVALERVRKIILTESRSFIKVTVEKVFTTYLKQKFIIVLV